MDENLITNPAYQSELDRHVKARDEAQRAIDLLMELGDIPAVNYVYVGDYGTPYLELNAPGEKARDVALYLQTRVRTLTGVVKHVKKQFSRSTGQVVYAVEGLRNVEIKVSGGAPSRCKVTKVTETITIPEKFTPARIETVTRYVIENPEECGAEG